MKFGTSWGDVEVTSFKMLDEGDYTGTLEDITEETPKGDATPFWKLAFKVKDANGVTLTHNERRYLSENAQGMLLGTLLDMGVDRTDIKDSDTTVLLRKLKPKLVNREYNFHIQHKPRRDDNTKFNAQINNIKPAGAVSVGASGDWDS